MDWLRRNWPDLAIGIALVAVIAGIIATLLTGGSFFPASPTQPTTPATVPPIETEAAQPTPGPAAPGGVAILPPFDGPADDLVGADDAAPGADDGPDVAVDPDPSEAVTDEPAPAVAEPAPAQPAAAEPAPAAAPAAPEPTAPVVTTPAVTPSPPSGPPPAASSDPEAPYRVSVGAFADPANAERQAAMFRDAGYSVFTGTQGSLTLVLVGPFESESDARVTVDRIRVGGFGIDPVIYRFDPDAADGPQAASPPAPTAAPVAAAPQPGVDAGAAPAPATAGRYLQVGAFSTGEGAAPLRERLAGLGYAASERREDGLIKVLVGPFDDAALSTARAHLAGQGIDSFVR
jgi:cell division protein FtsN